MKSVPVLRMDNFPVTLPPSVDVPQGIPAFRVYDITEPRKYSPRFSIVNHQFPARGRIDAKPSLK